jgi:hypothetical protein
MTRFLRVATLVFFAVHGAVALAGGPPLTCPTIAMAPTSLPNGDLATAYTPTVTSSGGTAPVAIDITHGVLPNGVNLTDNGNGTATFSGTSTQTGAFEFTITATDVNGCSGGRTYATTFAAATQTITFTSTAPAGATVGGPTYTVTATATSGLPVAFTIDATASSVCSIAGSTVSFIGVGTCVIDANQAGNATYGPAPQVQQNVAVGQGAQTITFTSTAPATATVGGATYTVTATATSGLPVTLTIDAAASAVCSIAGSTVSFTAVGTCVVDANQAGNANYTAAPQVQQSFAVGQGSQTITFTSTAPAAATVGGPTYTVTATATSGLPVTFTIDATATSVCSIAGSTVSFIAAGTCVIDANQAGNANYTAAPQVQQTFAVGKASQTISFTSTAPAAATVGGATYNVTATATSGLVVALTIDASASTVCTIAGSTVSFIGVGTCVIDANQAGDANYNPAPQAQQSFVVGKGNQTITFTSTAPAAPTVDGLTYTVTATASSGLPVTFSSATPSTCTVTGSTVTFVAAGTCIVNADQAGNANYNAAPQVQQTMTVGPGSQTITFTSTAPAAATFGGPTYTVTATASSGLTVTFTIDATASTVCSIAGSTVSFIGVGTCVIDANQAGNANYTAAPQVQQSFAVAKSNQTISFTSVAPAAAVVAGPTYNVTATSTSGLTVALTIDASASTVCTIAGSTVSFIGAGTCVIDANQAGNGNYNAAPQVQQSFVVTKQNQTITFTSTAPATAKNGGATYTVTATATSGLAVTFSSATPTICSVIGSTVTFIGAGTCTINADQAGNATYNPAPQVQQSFLVAKGDQTITITSVPPAFGATVAPNHTYNVTGTATSGLTVAFTIDATSATVCSIAGNTVTFNAAGTCTIDANQAGDVNWNPAPQLQQSVTVLVPANAAADSHAVTGNVGIVSTTSVLTNDTGTSIVIKSYGVNGNEQTTIGSATPTAQGGSVTLVAGGTYTFTPKANFTGTDSFKYIIDNGLVRPSTGTVTLTVTDRIVVVSLAGGGTCSPVTPSPCTLAVADAAALASGKDLIFVESGTYPGAVFTLFAAQNIVGQQVSLAQAITDVGITLATDSVALATIAASTRPVFNNGATIITLGGNNLVEYFNINPTAGSAILGSTIVNGATVHDVTITGTGTANGVNLPTSTAGTFNFNNLIITTATGNAFSAAGGGTVNVTTGVTPNTLAAVGGIALNVVSTTIGASGLNFQSISANGAANGIVLSGTGATGFLTVSGDGSTGSGMCSGGTSATPGLLDCDGSGGTIQNTTGDAVSLTNAFNVTLRQMNITNPSLNGVRSTGGGTIKLQAVNINHPGNSNPGPTLGCGSLGSGLGGGNGWFACNITGVNSFDNNSRVFNWQASQANAVLVYGDNTNFTSFTVDNAFLTTSATGAAGFHANLNGATTGQVTLTDSEFTLIDQNAAQIFNNGSGAIRAIVQRNNFHDADGTGGDGNNTLYLANSGSGQMNYTIGGPNVADGNTFKNLARLTVLAGVVQVDAAGGSAITPAGGQINGTIQHNTISNDAGFVNGRRAIDIQVEADSHNLGSLFANIADNTINNVSKQAVHISVVSVGGGSITDGNWIIQNNHLGDTSPVGTEGNVDSGSVIEFETNVDSFTSGADTVNKLQITNNVGVNNANNATGGTLDVTNLWGSTASGTTAVLQATITNNTFTNNSTTGGHVLDVLNSSAGDGETLNLNVTGNNTTLGASTAGEIRLRQLNGGFNVQGGIGNVSANNSGDTLSQTGAFGTVASVPLPTPPGF